MASAQAPVGQPQAAASSQPRARTRSRPLRRRPEKGVLGGVCAGLAERYGVAPLPIRMAMTLLVAVGGLGVAAYALAWALIPVADDGANGARSPTARRDALLAILGVAGISAALHLARLRDGEAAWPLVLGICGMALVWRPIAGAERPSLRGLSLREHLRRSFRADAPRLILGTLFVVFAAAALLHLVGVLPSLDKAIGAVAIVATVLGLLIVPWFVRLGRSLAFERSARIREHERAELAAHLHDSVLQTLALIQKRAGDPREVAGLARRQERELRSWLLARPGRDGSDSVAAALERAAAEVEELHRVPIEVVTVGDGPLDGRLEAVVRAAREAMTNAAKFAGSERVDLYAEVTADRVEVFVRDRGVGFDPGAIPSDRRGVRDSILARMERNRGRAVVHSRPGAGTEVELVMERGTGA